MSMFSDMLAGKSVPSEHPAEEKTMETLDIGDIRPDPANAENGNKLTDLEGLAENILFAGLQQPLLVRPDPENPGGVMVISGHRRLAALKLLAEGGLAGEPARPEYRRVPCLVDRAEKSEAMAELQLIYGNTKTRQMSSAALSKQAARVTELLYKLKGEGREFPGRMRDQVAEACQVSASRLAKLKVIRERLLPEAMGNYESGKLSEATAYALARMTKENQQLVLEIYGGDIFEWMTRDAGNFLKADDRRACRKTGGGCTNKKERLKKYKGNGSYGCGSCCLDCENAVTCRHACAAAKNATEEQRAELKKEKKRKKEEEKQIAEGIFACYRRECIRLKEALDEAGLTSEEALETLGIHKGNISKTIMKEGLRPGGCPQMSPMVTMSTIQKAKLAELLDVRLLWLLTGEGEKKTQAQPGGRWETGTPGRETFDAVCCMVVMDDETNKQGIRMFGRWNGQEWSVGKTCLADGVTVKWYHRLAEMP